MPLVVNQWDPTNWRGIAAVLGCEDLTDDEIRTLPLDPLKFRIRVIEIRQMREVIVDRDPGDES